MDTCPLCDEGSLLLRVGHSEHPKYFYPFIYSECSVCGSDQANGVQLRVNKRVMQLIQSMYNNVNNVTGGKQ